MNIRSVFVAVIMLWSGWVSALDLRIFIPKAGQSVTNVVVTLEHHLIERKQGSVAAKRLAKELGRELQFEFREMKNGEEVVIDTYCEVILRDWPAPSQPNFKLSCLAVGQFIPHERLLETLDEVVIELRTWIADYKKRSEPSRTRPTPMRSQSVRTA